LAEAVCSVELEVQTSSRIERGERTGPAVVNSTFSQVQFDPLAPHCEHHVLAGFYTMASASRSVTAASSSIMSMLRPRVMQARPNRFSPLHAQIRHLNMRPTRAVRRTHVSLNYTHK
jgi:hypothetical protein